MANYEHPLIYIHDRRISPTLNNALHRYFTSFRREKDMRDDEALLNFEWLQQLKDLNNEAHSWQETWEN
jgi:hypothetical protein